MSNMPLHQQQLEFMSALARHRVDFLNPFFDFLGYFDSPYFFYVLVPAIWLGFSYQWGLRIFYWFSLNTIVNSYLKVWIGWPRPSQDLPEIALFHPSSGGFPSGGAQLCMFLGGLLIYYGRTRAARIVGVTYILLISYSRLYLGVHYPIDILGGWVIAWLLLFLFIVVQKPLEKFLITRGLSFCLLLSLIVPLAIIALAQNPILTYIMGSLLGAGLGTYCSLKNHLFLPPPKNLMEGFGRAFIGIALVFLIVLLWPQDLPRVSKSFLASLLMSLAASPISRAIYSPSHSRRQ